MKGLILAAQFLTRLPLPAVQATGDDFARSMRWFPAVGLLIGALIAAAGWAGAQIDNWTGALCALTIWVLLTGALHLDGLADVADAQGAAHHGRERLLAALADPRIGSFGATTLILQLLAKLILMRAIIAQENWAALMLVPFAARMAPLVWARWLPLLHDGLGARFRHAVRRVDLLIWGAALLLAAMVAPALLCLLPGIGLWGLWVRRQLGGISGDSHGAGIEILETVLLLALVIAQVWP